LLERKQETIKVAAKELFLRHGYANMTMEMVAAQAKVSIMTLYRHFRGKDVLFQAVIQHLCSQLDHQEILYIPDPYLSAQYFLTLLQGPLIEQVRLGAGPAPTSEEIEQHITNCVTFFLAAHDTNHPD
jgi:AcrR family transcriptional regulator